MAFKFSVLCTLLQSLEDLHRHDPPYLTADLKVRKHSEIEHWFKSHRRAIDALDAAGGSALLSCLLPERRTDRVYGLQSHGLARQLCRHLCLSSVKSKDLMAFQQAGHGDLADCLERILTGGGPPAIPVVTLGEVDAALLDLAGDCRFSAPRIQLRRKTQRTRSDPLAAIGNLIRRCHPTEAKWLVRIILKDLAAIHLDEHLVLRSIHFLLPDILRFQQDFDAAMLTLKTTFRTHPSFPDRQSAALVRKVVSGSLRPQIGVKVSRSTFTKARSIDHCLQVTNKQHWMIERKYDGEFCEIHVDLTKGDDWLKIYSKSGKDSTLDRKGLRETLKHSLAIGTPGCRFTKQCIILGEMVVYNDEQRQIMPFHKIRKYVSRSGSYIGTAEDSQRSPAEHLMIIFFDLLLLDDDNMVQKSAEIRKSALVKLCRIKTGRAIIAESKVLDFSQPESKRKLMSHFAASIAARHEGLVLKPCGRPYLACLGPSQRDTSTFIKLKKDYIDGLGDEADLAVVGASYDPQVALAKGVMPKDFTHFHVACLANDEEDVNRYGRRPCFRVVGTISCDGCIPPTVLPEANRLARIHGEEWRPGAQPSAFDLSPGTRRMDVVFREPFVFEVLGGSYERPSDCSYWMLRHPRVKKLHQDRTWRDCASFADLQKMAKLALSAPLDSESQENLRWMKRIEASCRRKIARASAQTTLESKCTTSPGSVRKRGTSTTQSPDARRLPLLKSPIGLHVSSNEDHMHSNNTTSPVHSPARAALLGAPLQPISANVARASSARLYKEPDSPRTSSLLLHHPHPHPFPSPPPSSPVHIVHHHGDQASNKRPSADNISDRHTKRMRLAVEDLSRSTEEAFAAASAVQPVRFECTIARIRSGGECSVCPLSRAVILVDDINDPAVSIARIHGAKVVHTIAGLEAESHNNPILKCDNEIPDSQEPREHLLKVWHLGRPSDSGIQQRRLGWQDAQTSVTGELIIGDVVHMACACGGFDQDLKEDDVKARLQRSWEQCIYATAHVEALRA